jgi:phage terminase large subunit
MFQSVMDAADGTLATVGGEHRILQGGNPTNLDGPLYKAETIVRHLWKMINITGDPDNPRRSPRVSLKWARQQIASYGRDHDWCKVNVLGEFPSGSFNRFLSPDDVQKSMGRHLRKTMYNHHAKILGVDPGRFGGDRTVMFPRQGLAAFTPVVLRPNRSEKNWTGNVAARICRAFEKWEADACFIDDSGAWGSGILDAVREAGWNIQGVQFGGTALDPRYKNRRVEMHMLASEWVKDGGSLPFMPEIQREACASEYWFTTNKFVMEEKDQVKIKLNGDSPDLWDAFVLTFAQPVAPRTGLDWLDRKTMHARTDEDEDRQYEIQRALVDEN